MRLQVRLTVYFEDPFWVGVFERRQEGRLTAARVVFGAEPKDYTVYEHFLRGWRSLRFSPPVAAGEDVYKRQIPEGALTMARVMVSPDLKGKFLRSSRPFPERTTTVRKPSGTLR